MNLLILFNLGSVDLPCHYISQNPLSSIECIRNCGPSDHRCGSDEISTTDRILEIEGGNVEEPSGGQASLRVGSWKGGRLEASLLLQIIIYLLLSYTTILDDTFVFKNNSCNFINFLGDIRFFYIK